MPEKTPFNGHLYSLAEIKQHTLSLIQMLSQQPGKIETRQLISLPQIEKALNQLFEIAQKLEHEPTLELSRASDFIDVSDLGEYGLQLISGLDLWCDATNSEACHELPLIYVSIAVWIHDHHGNLAQIENIVNALSRLSNQSIQPPVLSRLHEYAEKITNSVAESIKMDTDKSEPGRPWRILNLNHGIIATRSHNIEIMNRVFEQLIKRLPEDAASFFADGMKQMEIIDYPEYVKQVMHRYYQLTNNPTLH